MPTTPTKPRDIKVDDVVRIEYLSEDLSVTTKDRKVMFIGTVPNASGRYRVDLEGENSPRFYSARDTLPIVTAHTGPAALTAAEDIDILSDFILARVKEDEAALTATTSSGQWEAYQDFPNHERGRIRHQPTGDRLGVMTYPGDARHAVRWQPARVKEELATKRSLVEAARTLARTGEEDAVTAAVSILRQLASVHADHPDYPQAGTWAHRTR